MSPSWKILQELHRHFANHDYLLQNVFIYQWESDFFCISSSGYAIEVEIKISRSDFKADFKKTIKHKLLSNASKELVTLNMGTDNNMSMVSYRVPVTPNKFYYCCPENLIDRSEIPDYAGLLYFRDKNPDERYSLISMKEVKPARFLHKNKHDLTKDLLSKYYYLYQNLKNEFIRLKLRVMEMENAINWKTEPYDPRIELDRKYFEPTLFDVKEDNGIQRDQADIQQKGL
jgi:hypothetical protein